MPELPANTAVTYLKDGSPILYDVNNPIEARLALGRQAAQWGQKWIRDASGCGWQLVQMTVLDRLRFWWTGQPPIERGA